MFQIYHSNKIDLQKDLLVELISRQPLSDPFQPETILVQSPGMAQWLKLELADKLKIAANIDFPLPASFLWRSFSTVLDAVPERSAFTKDGLTWALMELLPQQLERPEFIPLKRYLEQDKAQFKLYQLCGKVADIFDQYLVYRPDWIASWEAGDDLPDISASQPWQPVLWRIVQQHILAQGQSHWHRGNMFNGFVDALKQGQFSDKALPSRLFVFGISALPQNFIEALQALGQQIDVHLLVNNPCRYFWGDVVDPKYLARLNQRWLTKPGMTSENYYTHGNPLLSSLGKLGRDYLYQLQELAAPEIELFEDYGRDTLLSSIQQDILQLDDPVILNGAEESARYLLQSDDRSLVLHSAHSPLREVEILYDQLLAILDKQQDISPRDIIVMMPDVAQYAPYIEAVFGNAPYDRYIPFSISDRTMQQESPLLMSFLRLLGLPDSRVTVSEVLEILEVPAVLRRFNLELDHFERICRWIEACQIRWGIDAEHRQQQGVPAFEQNSWRFGLQRMLAGFAMGDTQSLWQGIEPYPEIEGLEAEDLGQLAEFVELLELCVTRLNRDQSIGEWLELLNEILLRAYLPDEDDEITLSQIRKALEQLQQQLQDSHFDQPLSWAIVRDYLSNQLGSSRSSQRFMVGAVNFCTLMPMRSIPFKQVCLLGMNDGVYPRSIPPVGFDLMAINTRRGDRSRRDDDRYLFLEAMLSAREKLYISYIGRSVQDNTPKVPSVLISELLEYCQQNYRFKEAGLKSALLTEHPLQPFSEQYFAADSPLFSYASEWLPVVRGEGQSETSFITSPLGSEPLEELELTDLMGFARNPVKHFFQRRLKVFFNHYSIDQQDEEPFQVDGLTGYQLKQQLLDQALKLGELDTAFNRIRASGLLPVGLAGQLQTGKLRQDCQEMADKIRPWRGQPDRFECQLSVAGLKLNGWLTELHPRGLLRYRAANAKGRDIIQLWLEHLVLCASGVSLKSCFFGLNGRHWFDPLDAGLALEHLQHWVNAYRQGLCEPLPLPADTSWVFVAKTIEKGPDQGLIEARKCYDTDDYRIGESRDIYLDRVYPDFSTLGPRFTELTELLYQPLAEKLQHSDTEEDDE
ncbi:exodeoxyribonuclease V subunit gamma [Amphritea balenae]|uniref:RecBCD enzyme subunit RecC n=1 Tax=Amphritea balenae TaxID=452629 RepID=A0A3P1SJC2_9GAMM|nr:exodeoxyribonuclease V subunit gamma [Amphritea balenae]RRC96845.1 exodeoxyribonuclease V subunit gamma [Amphritea balenae]GGK61206.1 RecBCD enzyme subunit RecC [Amphritea balenae]